MDSVGGVPECWRGQCKAKPIKAHCREVLPRKELTETMAVHLMVTCNPAPGCLESL